MVSLPAGGVLCTEQGSEWMVKLPAEVLLRRTQRRPVASWLNGEEPAILGGMHVLGHSAMSAGRPDHRGVRCPGGNFGTDTRLLARVMNPSSSIACGEARVL